MLGSLVVLPLLLSLLIACSKDKPAPVGPAGKITHSLDAPGEPTNLRCEVLSDSSARVSWDAVDGATDYDINYRTLLGPWTNEPHKGTRLYNTIYDLEAGQEYRWAVRAENKDGASAWVFAEENFFTPEDNDFDIQIIFPSPGDFTQEEKDDFIAAAQKWENVIARDMPSFEVPHDIEYIVEPSPLNESGQTTYIELNQGEIIDDLRIYILNGKTSYDPWWGYAKAGASYFALNPETNLVSIGVITYVSDENYFIEDDWLSIAPTIFFPTAVHEIGHVLGIGLGPQWDKFIEPGIKKYSVMQQTDLTKWGGNFFTGPKAWEALQRQPMSLGQKWVNSDGPNRKIGNGKRQYRPWLKVRYPNMQSRIIGTLENPGTMEELYTSLENPPYIGIGNGVPIRHHNYHWEYLLWSDYMSELSLVPGQRAIRDISEVTLGALEDMGYTVDYNKADICPLHLFNVQYVEYLSEDIKIDLLSCTWVGNQVDLPCLSEIPAAAKPTISQRQKYHHICGIIHP